MELTQWRMRQGGWGFGGRICDTEMLFGCEADTYMGRKGKRGGGLKRLDHAIGCSLRWSLRTLTVVSLCRRLREHKDIPRNPDVFKVGIRFASISRGG